MDQSWINYGSIMGQSCLDTLPASRATATSLPKLHACRRKTKLLGSAIFQTVGTADIYCAEARSTNTQACPQAEDQLSQERRPVPCPPPFPFPCLRITRHKRQTTQLRIANLAAPQPVRLLLTPDFEGSHSRSLDFPRADRRRFVQLGACLIGEAVLPEEFRSERGRYVAAYRPQLAAYVAWL